MSLCNCITKQTIEDLTAVRVPSGSVAEIIIWFDRHWQLDGFTFGVSFNGIPISTMPVGTSDGLNNRVVFFCDTVTGECEPCPKILKAEYGETDPAPHAYIQALDHQPDNITGLKYLFVNIVQINGRVWCNAYRTDVLQKISEAASIPINQAPAAFVRAMNAWGINRNPFAYEHNVWEGYVSSVMRPKDICGQCLTKKQVEICPACKFNMLCKSCKCSECDIHKVYYDKLTTTA